MHQKNAVAPASFGMAAVGADQLGWLIGAGLFSFELIDLKWAPTWGIRTSLKLHNLRSKYGGNKNEEGDFIAVSPPLTFAEWPHGQLLI
jgi:hypothetical protein